MFIVSLLQKKTPFHHSSFLHIYLKFTLPPSFAIQFLNENLLSAGNKSPNHLPPSRGKIFAKNLCVCKWLIDRGRTSYRGVEVTNWWLPDPTSIGIASRSAAGSPGRQFPDGRETQWRQVARRSGSGTKNRPGREDAEGANENFIGELKVFQKKVVKNEISS